MHSHLLDGEWIVGSGAPLAVVNPVDGSTIWQGAAATNQEVTAACEAARRAFSGWAGLLLPQRIAICERFGALLIEQTDSLAAMISREVGKPLWEARTEVASMAAKVAISVQAHATRTGQSSAEVADGRALLRHRPHGVPRISKSGP